MIAVISWCCVGLVATVAAWEAPTMVIGNNHLQYQNLWLTRPTNIDNYYARVYRSGRWYRTNIHEGDYYPVVNGDDHWTSGFVSTVIQPAQPASSYWWLENRFVPPVGERFVTYTLDENQRDFATMSFNYALRFYGQAKNYDLPIFSVSVCGQPPVAFGREGSKQVLVPNPGTCDETPAITFRFLDDVLGDGSSYFRVHLSHFSFNVAEQVIGEPVVLARIDGERFAHVYREKIECLEASCGAIIGSDWSVGDVGEDGNILSVVMWPIARRSAATDALKWLQVVTQTPVVESDGTLTMRWQGGSFTTSGRLTGLSLAVSRDPDALLNHWEDNLIVDELHREAYRQVAYIPTQNEWQVANFALGDEANWEAGFYLTTRARDLWGRYTHHGPFYWCQNYLCHQHDVFEDRRVYFSVLDFGDAQAGRSPSIRLGINSDYIDQFQAERFTIFARQDEGVTLTGSDDNHWGYQILSWPELTRTGGSLYLYDREWQEVIDEVEFGEITPGMGLVRDLNTWEWRQNYVRN